MKRLQRDVVLLKRNGARRIAQLHQLIHDFRQQTFGHWPGHVRLKAVIGKLFRDVIDGGAQHGLSHNAHLALVQTVAFAFDALKKCARTATRALFRRFLRLVALHNRSDNGVGIRLGLRLRRSLFLRKLGHCSCKRFTTRAT